MATVNFTTSSDADLEQSFVLRANGSPVDLTGSTFRMMVRKTRDGNEVFVSLDSAGLGGITITNAVGGIIDLVIPKARLQRMAAGAYVHSMIRTRPDGIFEEVWHGHLTHKVGPTR